MLVPIISLMLVWEDMIAFFNCLSTDSHTDSQLDRCYRNEAECWDSLKELSQNGMENILAEQDIIGFVSMGSSLEDCIDHLYF